jgi:hypothetical protein
MAHSENFEVMIGGKVQIHVLRVGSGCVCSDICMCEPYLNYTALDGDEVWSHKDIEENI